MDRLCCLHLVISKTLELHHVIKKAHGKIEYKLVEARCSMVGKICLINCFVRDVYSEEDYHPTIEDSYRKVISVDGECA